MTASVTVNVLAIGAHPDDAELGVGGILLKLADQGFSVGILDLTRGELSSRGTVDERIEEASEAARLLNIAIRRNAEFPDGGLENTTQQQQGLIPMIRSLKPRVILSHAANDRHPDHRAAYGLVRDANYYAGVATIVTEDEPYRAPHLYYYHPYYEDTVAPQLVVDISDFFEQKLEALKAHRSQFQNPGYEGPETFVESAEFWESIRTRAAYWGSRIHAAYGEPLYTDGPVAVSILPGLEGVL